MFWWIWEKRTIIHWMFIHFSKIEKSNKPFCKKNSNRYIATFYWCCLSKRDTICTCLSSVSPAKSRAARTAQSNVLLGKIMSRETKKLGKIMRRESVSPLMILPIFEFYFEYFSYLLMLLIVEDLMNIFIDFWTLLWSLKKLRRLINKKVIIKKLSRTETSNLSYDIYGNRENHEWRDVSLDSWFSFIMKSEKCKQTWH